ncbi:hypothetical protein TNCV_1273031, partial [Trichonephila clavipes]
MAVQEALAMERSLIGGWHVTCRVTEVLAVDTKWVFLSFFDVTVSRGMVFTAFKASWFHKTIRGSMVEVIAVEALGYSSNE